MYYCSSFSNLSYFRSNLYKKWQNLKPDYFPDMIFQIFQESCHCKRTSQRKNWKSLLMALVFHWSDPQTYFKWISCNIVGQGTKKYAWLPSKIPISLDNSVGKWGVLSHQLPPLWLPPPCDIRETCLGKYWGWKSIMTSLVLTSMILNYEYFDIFL